MLGKIYFKQEWRLCRYENDTLDILHYTCSTPKCFLQPKTPFNLNSVMASFEDGSIYFFDLRDMSNPLNFNEYIDFRFDAPNYFKTERIKSYAIKNLNGIRKITFKNGVLKPMLELSHIPKFEVEIEDVICKVCFRIKKKTDALLCEMKHGTMLSNNPSKITEYCIDMYFNKSIDIDKLNLIIDRLYKLVQFINMDYTAPIGSVEVKTSNGYLLYFKRGINYGQKPIVRYNYIANCKSIVQELSKNIFSDKYDMGFLSLIDKETYTANDYWILAQSIEKNVDIEDVNLQSLELIEEIELYKNLKTKISDTIIDFESNNGKIDKQKKSFILSLIEMPKFRQKIEFLYEKYNDFAKHNYKYEIIEDQDIKDLSQQVSFARNSIHGQLDKRFSKEKAETGATMAVLGLCLYILDECGAESATKFNFLQCAFA